MLPLCSHYIEFPKIQFAKFSEIPEGGRKKRT